MMQERKPIIVALDVDGADKALELARALDPALCRVKVGKELFTAAGPQLLDSLAEMGHEVFLDLKFHDIPHTVKQAVKAAADHRVWMLTVHASGGREMMAAAREACNALPGPAPLLVAVTVLTSMADEDLSEIGIARSPLAQVERLAALARKSGMDGVVCSASEATRLRALLHEDFLLVTPGIRPAGLASHDQKRVVTPEQALQSGSNYLVIGRPITRSRHPGEQLAKLHEQLTGVFPDLC